MLRVGFEIHQQLDTRKLFCGCSSELTDSWELSVRRQLRAARSELGEVDRAALQEERRARWYEYQVPRASSCLVELDEEPPHEVNMEAVEIALQVALLLNATPVDEIHFMRKIVVDGSNTSGFQRTAVVAMDGYIDTPQGRVGIATVCLEEEAARKVGESGGVVTYRLDRLGIPLIEISTTPDITSPEQAKEVARRIGEVLRATGRVRRGIGTIRQDINVSISGGARVEIKGVQDLALIPEIIRREVRRQRWLLEVAEELRRRGVRAEEVGGERADVTELFGSTRSKVLSGIIKRGGVVLALGLRGFAGLLGGEAGLRLGAELAQHVRVRAGLGGLFHSDELPAYGISEEEVEGVRRALRLGDGDAFVLLAGERSRVEAGAEAVAERARQAVQGVPEETRAAQEDGTTKYMRPLPGAARMYPETDIPPVEVSRELVERLAEELPELYEEKIERFVREYGLSRELAEQVVRRGEPELFEEAVRLGVAPTVAATALTMILRELRREGCEVERLGREVMLGVFSALAQGRLTKESLPEVLRELAGGAELEEVLRRMGGKATEEEVRRLAKQVIEERGEFVRERGEGAAKPLMGVLMSELRGRAEGRMVMQVLQEELRRFLEEAEVKAER